MRNKLSTYIIFTILVLVSFTEIVEAQLSGYEYRKQLTVDNGEVSGTTTLTNFPALISFTDADLATEANSGFVTSSNGFDIAFTSSDGTSQLDYELIEYTATTGELLAWVRFPSLSATSDTDFYIYFGNSSITTDQSISSTWDSDYAAVYHLDTDYTDASSNAENCTNNGTTISGTAQISSSAEYNANTDNIDCGSSATVQPVDAITVSAWVISNDDPEDQWSAIGGFASNDSWDDGYGMFYNSNTEVQFYVGNYLANVATGTINPDVWNYVVGTYDRFAGGTDEVKIYVNGVESASPDNYSTAIDYTSGELTIGGLGGWTTDWLDGNIDEFRLSDVARSADWITTEYNNQLIPGSFFSETEEPPVLANIEASPTSGSAGGAAVLITETLTLTTPFADSVESATIQITGNLDNTEDVLAFSDTGLITGSFTSGTGLMTLTGRASLADYQAALRSVTYQNTEGSSPTQTTRTISFTVEGLFSYTSNTVTRDLEVTTVLSDLSSDISNIVFHLDALDIDGDLLTNDQPSTGSEVLSWGDRSDNEGSSATDYSFTGTSPNVPTFEVLDVTKFSNLTFNGTSDILLRAAATEINSASFTEKSFAIVFRTGSSVSGFQNIYEQGGATRGYQISIKDGNAFAYTWNTSEWAGGEQQKSIDLGTVAEESTYIILASHDATSATSSEQIWIASLNGGSIITLTDVDFQRAHADPSGIGGVNAATLDPVTNGNASSGFFEGEVFEFISWNSALSSGQIASIYNLLCEKWCNIPSVLASIEGTNLDFSEGDSPTEITDNIIVSDTDNTVLDSAKVTVSSNFLTSEDELAFVDAGGIIGSWNSSTGVLSLSGNATLAQYQTALRSVTYENTNTVNPNTSIRQVDFIVYDWDDESNVASRNVNVLAINSSPTLSGITGGTLAYDEGDGTVTIISAITIADLDDTNIESATIEITGNYINGEDVLGFVDAGGITGSWNDITGILTLSGSATLAGYETALVNVTFENTSSDPVPLNRTVSFSVNDGDNSSNTQSRDISVTPSNSAPILSNLELSDLTYPQEAINISNTIEVSDPDDTTIDSARVLITGNFQSDEDSLFYSTLFGITGVYDETTGILALSGNASFSDYQTALRSVEYFNYSTIPTGPERVISFLAYDDDSAESDTLKRTLEVSAVESISDLKVWLRSDTGVDTTAGGEVITWEDQSGNGNDFLGVSGSGNRPTFSISNSELGGESAINFIGNGDSFEDADGHTNYINDMDEFTLFVVYKSDEVSSDQGLWIADDPSGADEIFTIRYDASGANGGGSFTNVVKTGILGNNAANQLESFSDIQSNTSAQITSLHWESGVTYDLYVDGILNNPSSAGAPPTGTITTATTAFLGKGGKDTGNNSWNGLIAEFILYCKNLSEAERQSVEDYLAVKYSSAIRKITPATGGESISADDANATFTSLTGPVIQEGFPGELTNSGTIVLTAPSGYKWNTGATPDVLEEPVYGGSTNLVASFTSFSGDSSTATFTISTASTSSNPGQLTFSGLKVRPNNGVLPNTGFITNIGTTGQGGGTNYGTLEMIAGAVDSLIFTQQPVITNINSVITPAVRVQIVDQFGNEVQTSGINVAIALNSGTGSLTGTSPIATNSLGIASFEDLEIDDVGAKTLITTSSGLDSKISSSFNIVNAGVLTGFTVQRVPSGNISAKTAGQTFNTLLTAVDGTGTTVTTFNGTVAVTSSCTMGTGNGTTASFSSGVLSSRTVSITSIGNCTITVTNSSGSETGVSNTFTVSAGAANVTTSTISASPTTILNDGASTTTLTVRLKDIYGNNRSTSGGTVVLSTTDGSLSAVTDNSNGTYTATLTSSTSTVTSTITGTLSAVSITDNALVEFAAFSHIWISQLGSAAAASDWDDADNWNVPSIPNSSSVVLIPVDPSVGNEYPVIDVDNTTIQELTLETNAQVTVSGSINFIVTGDISGEGDILGSNNDILTIGGNLDVSEVSLGTVIFDGSSEQTITSPHDYVNMEVDNSTTVSVSLDLTVTGTLTLTDGELLIPSGVNLFANTQSYDTGTIRFQREITGSRGWRMISSPVSSTIGDFLDGILTQGYSGAFYDINSSPGDTLQPNILTYLENYDDSGNGATDNQRYRTPTSSAQSLTEGQGVWAFIFGDIAADSRYNDPIPDTLDVNGQEFNGDGTEVEFGVTYLAEDLENGGGGGDGWNLVGNPFGAAINWDDNPNWTKKNIDATIYIWDPSANSGNGEFLTWNGTAGTLSNGLIAPFQGFWIKANSSSPELKVNLDAKTSGANFLRKDNSTINPVIELTASKGELSKRTLITFSEDANRQKDLRDGLRLVPFSDTHIEFYSLLDNGTQLEINNQPLNFENRINIPLIINGFENGNPLSGAFDLGWYINRNIPDDWQLFLIDLETGYQIDLRAESELFVTHKTKSKLINNSSPSSPKFVMRSKSTNISSRFVLRITTEEIEANIPDVYYMDQNYPNPFNPSTTIQYGLTEAGPVKLTIYDILGRKVQTLVDGNRFEGNYAVNFDAAQLASGVYIYQLITSQGVQTKKFTLIK